MNESKQVALNDEERATYEWQMWIDGFGEAGQKKLKGATALVSRCGGLGGLLEEECEGEVHGFFSWVKGAKSRPQRNGIFKPR